MSSTAIVLAAGEGKRFHQHSRKQFTELLSKPVLHYSLELFDTVEAASQLIVVGPEDNLDPLRSMVENTNLTVSTSVVPGGQTRFDSVQQGLLAVDNNPTETVFLHDAARPGATPTLCAKLVDELFNNESLNGVVPVLRIPDTVKRIQGDAIAETLDRRQLRRAQTPQFYRLDPLRESIKRWGKSHPPTDEAQLLEEAGHTVRTVQGELRCRKLTYPEDLRILEVLLGEDRP